MGRPELGVQLWGPTPARLAEQAQLAERAGLDSLSVPDHLAPRQLAPLTACAVLATATERMKIGTLVLNNDFRHPAVLAREVATIAELSGGRFELGLGAGHMRVEYDRAGLRYDPGPVRIGRLGESVAVLRRLLAGETVSHAGEHYALAGEQCFPVPPQPVPILVGGNAPAVRRLAAEQADVLGLTGFSFRRGGAGFDPQGFTCAELERQLTECPPPPVLDALVQWIEITPNRARAGEHAAQWLELPVESVLDSPYVLIGTAAEIAARLRELRERFGIRRWTCFADLGERPGLDAAARVRAEL